jgi:hypothetical protein
MVHSDFWGDTGTHWGIEPGYLNNSDNYCLESVEGARVTIYGIIDSKRNSRSYTAFF